MSPPRVAVGGSRVRTPANELARGQVAWVRAMRDLEGAWKVVVPEAGGQSELHREGLISWPPKSTQGSLNDSGLLLRVISLPLDFDGGPPVESKMVSPGAAEAADMEEARGKRSEAYDASHLAAAVSGGLKIPPGCPPNVERVLREKLGSQIQG